MLSSDLDFVDKSWSRAFLNVSPEANGCSNLVKHPFETILDKIMHGVRSWGKFSNQYYEYLTKVYDTLQYLKIPTVTGSMQ